MSPEDLAVRLESLFVENGMDKLDAYENSRATIRRFLASGAQELYVPLDNLGKGITIYRKVSTTADTKAETQRLPPVENPKKNSLFD